MKLSLNPRLIKKYPNISFGIICCKINNKDSKAKEVVDKLLGDIEVYIRHNFHPDMHPLYKGSDLISAAQVILQEFHTKKHYHTRMEALMKKIFKREHIEYNTLIEGLINYAMLKYLIPINVFDAKSLNEVIFDYKNKKPIILNNKKEIKNLFSTEKSKLFPTKNTKKVLIVLDGIPPIKIKFLEKAVEGMKSLCEIISDNIEIDYLDQLNRDVVWD